jgi:thioredoxin 1
MSDESPPPPRNRNLQRLLIVAALAIAIAAVLSFRPGPSEPGSEATGPRIEDSSEPVTPDPTGRPAGPQAQPAVAGAEADGAAANPANPATAPATTAALPRLVDLGADKCVPCKMMAPILADLRRDYEGRFEVIFIDVWKERSKAAEYGIQVIPTQIFYDASGKELFRHQGFFSREEILRTWREQGFAFEDL